MPYHDPEKPFVNYWFAASDSASLSRFVKNFTLGNLERLVEARGLCIAYVHFGAHFARNGKVDPEFSRRLQWLASRDGWFAPVSTILDYLHDCRNPADGAISPKSLRRLETRWLADSVRKRLADRLRKRRERRLGQL